MSAFKKLKKYLPNFTLYMKEYYELSFLAKILSKGFK